VTGQTLDECQEAIVSEARQLDERQALLHEPDPQTRIVRYGGVDTHGRAERYKGLGKNKISNLGMDSYAYLF